MTPDLAAIKRRAEAANKAAPGEWSEDALWNNDSGGRYRDSRVLYTDPRTGHVNVVCDTLNAHYGFDPDERAAIGEFIAACDPTTVLALLTALSAAEAKVQELRRATDPKVDNISALINNALHHLQADGALDRGDLADMLRQAQDHITCLGANNLALRLNAQDAEAKVRELEAALRPVIEMPVDNAELLRINPVEQRMYKGKRVYRGLDGHWYVRGLFDWMHGRFLTEKEALEYCDRMDQQHV